MIPAPFDYVRAESVDHALALIAEHGDEAKFLAGGHSLLPLMKLRLAQPAVLIDVARLRDLAYIRDEGEHIAIGALTTHSMVEHSELLAAKCPLLPITAVEVGDPQVRHRGTLGGTIAHGDAASDLPAATLALGATFVAVGPHGRREIPAADFFHGFLETALAPDELLVEVRVPAHPGMRASFQKFNRRAQDWAIVGVAAWRAAGGCGIGLVNMGSTPILARQAMQALTQGASAEETAALVTAEADPQRDLNASPEFRVHLAKVLARRAVEACAL